MTLYTRDLDDAGLTGIATFLHQTESSKTYVIPCVLSEIYLDHRMSRMETLEARVNWTGVL